MTDPRSLVIAAAKAHPRKLAGVAAELDYSRPALSRYVNGSYSGAEKLEAAILSRYDRRQCPHTGEDLAADICRRRALSPQPYGGQAKLAQWTACQACPHKPTEVTKS